MNRMPPYYPPDFSQIPPIKRKNQFPPVLSGLLYMIGHYVLISLISLIAFCVILLRIFLTASNQFPSDFENNATELLTRSLEVLFDNSELLSLVSQIVSVGIVVLIFCLICRKNKEDKPSANAYFSLKKVSPAMLIMCAMLAFGSYFIVNAFVNIVNQIFTIPAEDTETAFSVVGFLTFVVGAPVCEELIYRNMAITNMNKRLSPIISILISSLIFGLVHGSPVQIVYAGVLGFVFGILFVRTKSIFPSLLAHSVFNAMGYVLPLLVVRIEEGSAAETAFSIAIAILTVVSLILVPLVIWWIFRHTTHSLTEKPIRDVGVSSYGNGMPDYSYGYPPPYPPYGYPAPPPGWIFDQCYGWIFVGFPTGTQGVNGAVQNIPTDQSTEKLLQDEPSDKTDEIK